MPCCFVSSGVEIPMTNEAFDLIWNSFGNKELTDSETSSSSEETYKTNSSVNKNNNAEWRKAGGRILQQKTEQRDVFPKILPRENETTVRMQYMRFCREL